MALQPQQPRDYSDPYVQEYMRVYGVDPFTGQRIEQRYGGGTVNTGQPTGQPVTIGQPPGQRQALQPPAYGGGQIRTTSDIPASSGPSTPPDMSPPAAAGGTSTYPEPSSKDEGGQFEMSVSAGGGGGGGGGGPSKEQKRLTKAQTKALEKKMAYQEFPGQKYGLTPSINNPVASKLFPRATYKAYYGRTGDAPGVEDPTKLGGETPPGTPSAETVRFMRIQPATLPVVMGRAQKAADTQLKREEFAQRMAIIVPLIALLGATGTAKNKQLYGSKGVGGKATNLI